MKSLERFEPRRKKPLPLSLPLGVGEVQERKYELDREEKGEGEGEAEAGEEWTQERRGRVVRGKRGRKVYIVERGEGSGNEGV